MGSPAFGSARSTIRLAYLLFVICPLSRNLRGLPCPVNTGCLSLFIQRNGVGIQAWRGVAWVSPGRCWGDVAIPRHPPGRGAADSIYSSCSAPAKEPRALRKSRAPRGFGHSIELWTQIQYLRREEGDWSSERPAESKSSPKGMLLSARRHGQLHHRWLVPAFLALPCCGKQTLTPVLSSLTENIHFAATHTLGITGNRRLYIEVGTTLPSHPGAEGLPRTCAHSTFRGRRRRNSLLWLTESPAGSPVRVPLRIASPSLQESRACIRELPRAAKGFLPAVPSCWQKTSSSAIPVPSFPRAPGSIAVTASAAEKISSKAVS